MPKTAQAPGWGQFPEKEGECKTHVATSAFSRSNSPSASSLCNSKSASHSLEIHPERCRRQLKHRPGDKRKGGRGARLMWPPRPPRAQISRRPPPSAAPFRSPPFVTPCQLLPSVLYMFRGSRCVESSDSGLMAVHRPPALRNLYHGPPSSACPFRSATLQLRTKLHPSLLGGPVLQIIGGSTSIDNCGFGLMAAPRPPLSQIPRRPPPSETPSQLPPSETLHQPPPSVAPPRQSSKTAQAPGWGEDEEEHEGGCVRSRYYKLSIQTNTK